MSFQKSLSLFCATVLVAVLGTATAATQMDTMVSVQSGGATVEEFSELNRENGPHLLKLVLASKGSGAYLADVDVSVRALPSHELVLQHRAQGPLMLATLPPGHYEVSATYADVKPGAADTIERTVTVGQGRTQMVLYFDTGDDLSPDSVPEYSTR